MTSARRTVGVVLAGPGFSRIHSASAIVIPCEVRSLSYAWHRGCSTYSVSDTPACRSPRRVEVCGPLGDRACYVSALGDWRKTSAETRRALLEAMGADASESGPPTAPVRVLRARSRARLGLEGELQLEDGRVKPVRGTLPAGVPPGYHTLRTRTGET